MKVDIQDIKSTIKRWNKLNEEYQIFVENPDIENLTKEREIKEEMDLIESACVAKHMFSDHANAISSPVAIDDFIKNNDSTNIKSDLSDCKDSAIVLLKAKLSKNIAKYYKEIYQNIITKCDELKEEIDEEGKNQRDSYLERLIIPFISETLVLKICDKISNSNKFFFFKSNLHNTYLSANLRSFFITPLKLSIKQNFGEDISQSDAEYLIQTFRNDYSYEMKNFRNGNLKPLKDRLYGKGILHPSSITEMFCSVIVDVFSDYDKTLSLEVDNVFNPN